MSRILAAAAFGAVLTAVWLAPSLRGTQEDEGITPGAFRRKAEFHFVRIEYTDAARSRRRFGGMGRGWWQVDWPEADFHFAQGIRRLTKIDVGEGHHFRLTDPQLFEHPWVYATQAAYLDLSKAEMDRLREYLFRGGFLVLDDFHGPDDWEAFRAWISQVLPEFPIVEIENSDPVTRVVYEIKERVFIPGLRHLRPGPGGTVVAQPQYTPPIWRGIYDNKGRLMVAINFNMDVGDAWEHADLPEYPEQMTTLAYRFGINYIVYSMTH